ncbi:hypothetical protein R0381_002341 [Jeongeupia wiesaeckerbachi]
MEIANTVARVTPESCSNAPFEFLLLAIKNPYQSIESHLVRMLSRPALAPTETVDFGQGMAPCTFIVISLSHKKTSIFMRSAQRCPLETSLSTPKTMPCQYPFRVTTNQSMRYTNDNESKLTLKSAHPSDAEYLPLPSQQRQKENDNNGVNLHSHFIW